MTFLSYLLLIIVIWKELYGCVNYWVYIPVTNNSNTTGCTINTSRDDIIMLLIITLSCLNRPIRVGMTQVF